MGAFRILYSILIDSTAKCLEIKFLVSTHSIRCPIRNHYLYLYAQLGGVLTNNSTFSCFYSFLYHCEYASYLSRLSTAPSRGQPGRSCSESHLPQREHYRSIHQKSEHYLLSHELNTLHCGPINLAQDAKLTYTITPRSDSALFQLHVNNSELLNNTQNERVWIAFGFGESGSGSLLGADIATVEFYVGDVNKCDIVDW